MDVGSDHVTAEAPRGAAARALPPCDLVMKGGITSGVVYPGVVLELAHQYRFASIGGSSAGAIAAALSAAAEYGRQRDEGGGLQQLEDAVDDLRKEGFLLGLFQPTKASRPLFEVLTSAFAAGLKPPRRVVVAAIHAMRHEPVVALIGAILLAGLVVLTIAASGALPSPLAFVLAALVVLVILVTTAVAAMGRLVYRTVRALGKSNFGMCPGTQQDDRTETALIDWLHERIQACAGRGPLDKPLTFQELEDEGVRLTMMTTDLSLARPVRMPDGLDGYWFKPGDFEGFPKSVVDAMSAGAEAGDAPHRPLPGKDLPILVGVRLSLSFPVLLSAVPLYRDGAPGADRPRHLFSDGGISSNFPIHFFDAWFPRHPTFGIDLADHPGGDAEDVFMLRDPLAPAVPRWGDVTTFPAFAAQIMDAAQNWRDTLQSELPGYRDRVCQIRLADGQGGLHLSMDLATIETLIARGGEAGAKIRSTFDERQWRHHRWVRYLTLMAQLQEKLHDVDEPFGLFGPELGQGLPDVNVYRDGRDAAWCARANEATAALLALAGQWGPPPLDLDLDGAEGPVPRPDMRIVPSA
jgi:predicted acylesterase/phospholipase RssA